MLQISKLSSAPQCHVKLNGGHGEPKLSLVVHDTCFVRRAFFDQSYLFRDSKPLSSSISLNFKFKIPSSSVPKPLSVLKCFELIVFCVYTDYCKILKKNNVLQIYFDDFPQTNPVLNALTLPQSRFVGFVAEGHAHFLPVVKNVHFAPLRSTATFSISSAFSQIQNPQTHHISLIPSHLPIP